MATAAMLALDECRDTQRCAAIRQRLHDHLDHWLDTLEARVKDTKPTLEQLTQAVFVLRQEWTPAVTAGVVEQAQRGVMAPRTAAGSQCGQRLSARGPPDRPVETLVGAGRRRRPSVDCAGCRWGRAPLAATLGLADRRQPPDVQNAVVQWTQEIPSETACELFQAWTGLPRSAHTAHAVTHEVAAGLTVLAGTPSREAIAAKIAAVAAGHPWRPILVLAMDGAEVPTRPETAQGRGRGRQQRRTTRAGWIGAWREATGCRLDLVADERIAHVLSWHPVHTDEELAAARQHVTAAGVMPAEQGRLGMMADGAPWIGQQVHALLPSAVEIRDDDQGCEHLSKVAGRQDRDHPERPYAWCEAAVARRFWGEVHGVIWGLQRMNPADTHAADESDTLIRSVPRHQERLDDRCARQAGYPIGSGGIASANTFIGHVRLKRSGAWWYVTNANQMLA